MALFPFSKEGARIARPDQDETVSLPCLQKYRLEPFCEALTGIWKYQCYLLI